MNSVKVGVVGVGHLGTYHLQKYRLIDGCTVVGVADIDPAHCRTASEGDQCEAYADHRGLIGKVDAVSIAVPTESHYAVAKDFLEAGVDVLLEKPMTATREEADDLIRLAEQSGAVLQVGFIERFNPAIAALEKVIERPLFIESHRLHPFFSRGTDVDVVLDLMIHDLDIILHFVKAPPSGVEAVGVSVLSDKVDIANARITFRNGSVANVTASRVTNKKMQKIRFFGPEGYHSVDYDQRDLTSFSRRKTDEGKLEIRQNNVEVENRDPLEMEIREFVDAVITRRKPAVSGEEGRDALDLALLIAERITQQGSVRL
ncbi:MAG: Gfo/Idh/MocA family oxidoreductase [Deltaproteobacteria bacterium]|nr:Gfo/Idh/MocA family oxidoreductase [Deltaproteobacteria bacterium]